MSKIRSALGLNRCLTFCSPTAPISSDIKKFFLSLDLKSYDAFGMSEMAGCHGIGPYDIQSLDTIRNKFPGAETKVLNPDERGHGFDYHSWWGEYAPVHIEYLVKPKLPNINNALLIGDKKKFLTMFVTLKTEMDAETGASAGNPSKESISWMESLGVSHKTIKDVSNAGPCPKVLKTIQERILPTKHAISNAQRIKEIHDSTPRFLRT
ncbi:unnamed protein product [Hermetia illucens]|uniref:Uncharacterized protein n=1 Tax=Hermetia illucens TaxID=343691 RepID=A0A7R8V628_HERIL|nr:unnamed protein product [Hermetia illucens]